jgi:hypothetical protein
MRADRPRAKNSELDLQVLYMLTIGSGGLGGSFLSTAATATAADRSGVVQGTDDEVVTLVAALSG